MIDRSEIKFVKQRMLANISKRPLCGVGRSSKLPTLLVSAIIGLGAISLLAEGAMPITNDDNGNSENDNNNNHNGAAIQKHPVFFSEYKLRASIETLNKELRELKRSFMKQTNSIYLSLKLDPQIGFERASRGSLAALAATLLSEQFADIVIKRHIIERRLLTGLKVAYVKFLPLNTLKQLTDHFECFQWLKTSEQVDLRPLFPEARETELAQLYNLIGLRARVRAADDLATLTANNIKRVLNIKERFLNVDRKRINYVTNSELNQLADHTNKVLAYYLDEVIRPRQALSGVYERQLTHCKRLTNLVGGQTEFVRLLDRLIGTEVLDIDLNAEATRLSLPPTISETMMANLELKWLPSELLKAVEESRRILLDNKARIVSLVTLKADLKDLSGEPHFDVASKCADASLYICKNYPLNV